MEHELSPERLRNWLIEIAGTQPEEIDCDALAQVLESLVAIAESGEDIASVLPDVAVHLSHCPECRDWFETLRAFSPELD